jgi:hypothetical protein
MPRMDCQYLPVKPFSLVQTTGLVVLYGLCQVVFGMAGNVNYLSRVGFSFWPRVIASSEATIALRSFLGPA